MNLFKSKNIERKIDPQNKNFNNIEEWWFNKSLQSSRRKFCSVFVRQANNPTNELKSIFAELSK